MLFEGNGTELSSYLATTRGRYYVYLLCRPDGTPFYIGKGIARRALEHEAEARRAHPIGESNPFKCNVIRKIISTGAQILYRIDSVWESADQRDCLLREAALIAEYKRLHEGGCLTNLVGGVGALSGAAPFSLAKHAATLSGEPADNPDRVKLNRFLAGIGEVKSVPIKPLRQISRVLPTTPHPSPRKPTARCAFALVASASAHGLALTGGMRIPRSFIYDGVEAIVENGVARDILKADVAHLVPAIDPRDEAFELSTTQVDWIVSKVGRRALEVRGLL